MAEEAILASSPPRNVGRRPKSSDSNHSRSRWPLTFSRSMSNNSITSSLSNGAAGSSASGSTSTTKANGGIASRSQRGQMSLPRAVKNLATERPGSASTVDSFVSALPSPSLFRSDLPSPRSSLHSSTRERRMDNIFTGGQNGSLSEGMMKEEAPGLGGEVEDLTSLSSLRDEDDLIAPRRRGPDRPYKSPDRKEHSPDSNFSTQVRNGFRSASGGVQVPVHPLDKIERPDTLSAQAPGKTTLQTPRSINNDSDPPLQALVDASAHNRIQQGTSSGSTLDVTLQAIAPPSRTQSRSPNATLRDVKIGSPPEPVTASSDPVTYDALMISKQLGSSAIVSPEKSGSALRQKLKKTGDFFKRMGSSTNTTGNSRLIKRSSQSSLASESGASIAHSTKSAPGTSNARWYNSAAEPLPSMPDIFKDNYSHSLPRDNSSSTIQSEGHLMNRQGQHMSPSSADGSTGSSTTEMRHTLQAWKREMDSTLEHSGQDLDEKTRISTPTGKWKPTPQLPECRLLNRPTSFMDDDDDDEDGGVEQSETLRSADTVISRQHQFREEDESGNRDKRFLSPGMSHTRRSTSLGVVPHLSASEDISNTSAALNTSRAVSSDDTGRYRKIRSRNEQVSFASVASYETAMERTSSFLSSEETSNRPSHGKDRTITQLSARSDPQLPSTPLVIEGYDQGIDEEAMAQELAFKCWNEDESHRSKDRIAEWLGKNESLHEASRRIYMSNFDFTNLRIDVAFRRLCDKLYLRAETQQIDRILSAFGQRYFDCNPQSKRLLLNPDVVHALVFSILLLNTDLHVAEMHDRMTRNQFVRNTMAAILESNESLAFSSPDASEDPQEMVRSSEANGDDAEIAITERDTTSFQSRKDSIDTMSVRSVDGIKMDTPSFNAQLGKIWEVEMESLLKDVYMAVKNDQIRLPFGVNDGANVPAIPKTLKFGTDRVNALKRGSIRGLQGLLGSTNLSSSIKVDESPSLSRVSLNSTHQSQSDSFTGLSTPSTSLLSASTYGLPPTLGFANTLSQSIIKEAKDEDDNASLQSAHDDPTDDELALMGPPWAKEGNLTRKLYWESPQRRAKDKTWTNCFVVVEKGTLSMFKFGEGGSTNAVTNQSAVGGGNWLSNATCIGEFSLAHTVANALPPPGYNRARPHVFALTLPNGRVYFFQAGHEDLLQEWVSTCNYWAARQSKEPLAGGVSNMEYGWNSVMPDEALDTQGDEENTSIRSHLEPSRASLSNMNSDTRSIRSGKSAKSLRARATNGSLFRSQTGGTMASLTSHSSASLREFNQFTNSERPVYINEWREPAPPTVSSTLNEEDQLEACKKYKQRVELELMQHNALKKPMMNHFQNLNNHNHGHGQAGGSSTNRFHTATMNKAIANFDRKANYLLSDLTKFTLYTATLTSANKLKAEKRDARSINRMMLKADEESSKMKEEEEGPPIKMS